MARNIKALILEKARRTASVFGEKSHVFREIKKSSELTRDLPILGGVLG